MERREPSIPELLISLIVTLAMTWAVIPPQDRLWVKIWITRHSRRVLAELAALEGRAGMGYELSGRDPSGRYNAAYWLSTARDKITKAMQP